MIPYPGESLAISDAVTSTSTDITTDLIYRGGYSDGDAGHAVLPAGETWRAWVVAIGDYQDDDDPGATYSWVLEVLSGTATLRLSETIDPTWGGPPLPDGDTALGEFTVTGPATLAVPSTFTTQQGWAGDPFMLEVECLSGSVDVQQVKLRLWPPGGPVGGWSSQFPAWTSEHAISARGGRFDGVDKDTGGTVVSATGEGAPDAPFSSAFTAYEADMAAEVGHLAGAFPTLFQYTPVALGTLANFTGGRNTEEVLPEILSASSSSSMAAVLWRRWSDHQLATANPVDSSAVSGLTYIRSPYEVAGDVAAYADTGGAVAEWSWASGQSIELAASATETSPGFDPDNPAVGFAVVVGAPSDEPAAAGGGNYALDLSPPVSGASVTTPEGGGAASTSAAVPTSGHVLLRAAPVLSPPPDFSGFEQARDFTASLSIAHTVNAGGVSSSWQLTGVVSHPPFRVWDPNAVVDVMPKVRQLHRDDGRGMTARRHFGGASRANTGRHFGYD